MSGRAVPLPGPEEGVPEHGTYGSLLSWLTSELGSATKARWILEAAAAGATHGAALRWRLSEPVDPSVEAAALRICGRAASGEPLQYALGTWQFRQLEVVVDQRVLIPRPETEIVVEFALEELARISHSARSASGARRPLVAVDLGTGSGVIALSLAVEFSAVTDGPAPVPVPESAPRILAVDSSSDALEVARENLGELSRRDRRAAAAVELLQGDWFDALPKDLAGVVDLVVSNPPYLSESDWDHVDETIRTYEPRSALVAGARGLEALERIVEESPRWMAAGGSLVLELAPWQADVVMERARSAGFVDLEIRRDLAGLERALVARRPG